MLKEFQAFISRGNVVDLAVGVIIGAAFTAIVNSLVSDVLMPPIGLLLGGVDFSNFFLVLKPHAPDAVYTTLKEAQDSGAVTVNYGLFLDAVIKFLIVAFAVFLLVKQINTLQARMVKQKASEPVPPSPQEVLLTEIRDLLKR